MDIISAAVEELYLDGGFPHISPMFLKAAALHLSGVWPSIQSRSHSLFFPSVSFPQPD